MLLRLGIQTRYLFPPSTRWTTRYFISRRSLKQINKKGLTAILYPEVLLEQFATRRRTKFIDRLVLNLSHAFTG